MDCTKCGFSNPDASRFCAGCGHTIAQIECQNCNGINPPGSRFCTSCGNSLSVETASTKPEEKSQAERRLLTVMFCDLVDSTTIVDSLDPEETRTIIRGFQSHARTIIEKSGGRITEYLGDGIVAQFTRHETNAERAIQAGLALIQKLEEENTKIGITNNVVQVRCGIATGLAVVGDMLGDARIRSESAIGLPLNLAARIQGLANPSEIVIAGDTFRLTRGLFEFEDIGKHNLKGIKDPQQVWRVVNEKNVSSRFMAHAVEMTPMVDREDAMGVLLNCWESSKRGHADAVIFTGEAGIGKSRILQELGKKISVDDFHFLEYQCAPYHINTALYPVISRLEAVSAFKHSDNNEQRLEKLEDVLRRSSDNFEKEMPAFISLLGLQAEDTWALPNLDPDERKELIFATLIENMFSLAKTKPVLIKIEDVHWVDPTTLELMSRMVRSLKGHNILLLITSRPGFEADFIVESHVTRLEIDRLPQQYTAQLIEGVQGASDLPKEVIDEIIKRTEGVPLFTEELCKSLMESMQTGGSTESSLLVKKDIPTTLHDSLLSRLDRLPKESKSIAQLAAVIGRDFSFDLLEQIANYKDKNLYKDLTPLLESQLVYQDKAPPYAEFCFKHALVRDVAYENLLQSQRIDIHKRIAEAIEKNYPEIIKNTPELVARHFTESKEHEKAAKYWLEAGKKASQSSANIEARNHLEAGLSLLKHISNKQKKDLFELELLLALGPIIMSTYGTGAKQTHDIYKRALEISNENGDSDLRFVALWNSWRMSVDEGFSKAAKWSDELLEFAKQNDNTEHLLQAHHCKWGTLYNLGDQQDCLRHIEVGLELYDLDRHAHHASVYGGHDPKGCALHQSALSLWLQGEYARSERRLQQSVKFAKSFGHLGTLLHNIDGRLMFYKFNNNFDALKKVIQELRQLCTKHDLPDYEAKVKIFGGWADGLYSVEHAGHGFKLLEQGLKMHEDSGTWEDRPVYKEMQAQLKGILKQYSSAINNIDKAIYESSKIGVCYWDPELYRRKASLMLAANRNDSVIVEELLTKASNIASQQNARSLELRSCTDLAKLYISTSDYDKTLLLLEPICNWFAGKQLSKEVTYAVKLLESARDKT